MGVTKPLEGQVALVAGATRGAGRGIAVMLGEAGATVVCTGRSVRADGRGPTAGDDPFDLARRPETIEETAERVTAAGGVGVPVRVDHTDEAQVAALFARIEADHGRLDVLVNDIWGGDGLVEWGLPFWEQSLEKGFAMLDRVIRTHVITSRLGVPLLVAQGRGLVVEVTDGDTLGYRSDFFYDLAKVLPIRFAYALASDLAMRGVTGITSLAITPGFLRSEAVLQYLGVGEENWRDGAKKDPHFAESETPSFVGRAVAALAADPEVRRKAGGVYASGTLAREYGFRDVDGRQPDFGTYFDGVVRGIVARGAADDEERALVRARYYQIHLDPARAEEVGRMAALLGIASQGSTA